LRCSMYGFCLSTVSFPSSDSFRFPRNLATSARCRRGMLR
jgi:hypothetical protein